MLSLDKFYTKPELAESLIFKTLSLTGDAFDVFMEPSAGSGSFSSCLFSHYPSQTVAIDIEPDNSSIQRLDFLKFNPLEGKKYVVIGNPPFGKVSSLAIQFFNKAAEFSSFIAFILPRTFRRKSVHDRINPYFHLIYDEDIPPKSFTPDMQAKCCFQVWERKEYKRNPIVLNSTTSDFSFLPFSKIQSSNLIVRAYGSNCGEIFHTEDLRYTTLFTQGYGSRSWHFIKCHIPVEEVVGIMEKIDFSFSNNTARQSSVGVKELVHYYNEQKLLTCKEQSSTLP